MNDARSTQGAAPRFGVNLDHGWVSFLESGDGEPVLFLHGLNGNASSWQDQLSELAPDMKMVAWDAPGYGKSDAAGNTVEALARVAIAFAKRVWPGPLNVVGHSMGGLVAMKMAVLEPQLIKRLVLSCTHPGHGLGQSGGANERYRRRLEELRDLPPEVYGERRAKGMLPAGTDERIFQKVARVAAESRSEGVANAAWAIQTEDLQPELTRIQAPTLVITCEQDKVAPLAKAQPLLDRIPDVRHVELAGLGHAPYMENARWYNTVLKEFLIAGA
ncbi:alpha/beta hydrolase [Marinobacter salarius]|uniref:alpha/beta fold hydrolase n=1 Tax=Marinobacter salarius TaxID=1420917 RepID=UPI001D18380B|nr:alpha/beta hydrolase [Marinobacter salarius]MCC4284174.1 alpha/beta hydrolase [Marinobacter salarius]MDP4534388.1 alpha/beta hydrolase [Marinobacter salarius]